MNFADGSTEARQFDVRQLDQQVIVIRKNNPSAALAVGFGKCLEQATLQGGQFIGFAEVMLVLVACGGDEVPPAATIWMGRLMPRKPTTDAMCNDFNLLLRGKPPVVVHCDTSPCLSCQSSP